MCLFYLLVSHSFTMLSREPEISWCSWVGDHFTDVTQPVWEVRDRRTKEPSGQEKKRSCSQPMSTATGPFKMHTKFGQQHLCVWSKCMSLVFCNCYLRNQSEHTQKVTLVLVEGIHIKKKKKNFTKLSSQTFLEKKKLLLLANKRIIQLKSWLDL